MTITNPRPVRLRYVSLISVSIVLLALALRFVTEAFSVPSSSMAPTLLPGDHVLVVRFIMGTPRHGDVVVFDNPSGGSMIKRVIGLPGDSVQIRNGHVMVNGIEIAETAYTQPSSSLSDTVHVVPRDHIFLLGDNRDHSADSREFGFVPTESLVGRARLIYWSTRATDNTGSVRWERVLRLVE